MENSKEVDEYISTFPEKTQERLREIRALIHKAVPHTTECINYAIPAFTLVEGGKREEQILIAGYKNHIGFYPHPTTIEKFQSELSEFKSAKGSVQFPLKKPLPTDLILRMIEYRRDLISNSV